MKLLLKSVCFIFLISFLNIASGQNQTFLGPSILDVPSIVRSSNLNIAIDNLGIPVIAYLEAREYVTTSTQNVVVKKLGPNGWVKIGMFEGEYFGPLSLVISKSGSIFIAFRKSSSSDDFNRILKKYEKGKWIDIPGAKMNGKNALVINEKNNPVCAYNTYNETFNGRKVAEWTGSEWRGLGDSFTNHSDNEITLKYDRTGILHLAFKDYSTYVYALRNNKWELIANPVSYGPNLFIKNLAFDSLNTPYLFTKDYRGFPIVSKSENNEWKELPTTGTSSSHSNLSTIIWKERPTLIYVQDQVTVKSFIQNQWVDIGEQNMSEIPASETCIAQDENGTLWKAYLTNNYYAHSDKVIVKRLEKNIWKDVHTCGISDSISVEHKISIDSEGNPFLASFNPLNYQIELRHWNGLSWTFLSRTFGTKSFNFYVHKNIPYLTNLGTILRFTSGRWDQIGTLPTNATLQLFFDSQNQISTFYPSYSSITTSWSTRIVKLVNGSWVTLGEMPGNTFFAMQDKNEKLVIGIPKYTFFPNGYIQDGIMEFQRLEKTGWVNLTPLALGTLSLTNWSNVQFLTDSKNQIYILYPRPNDGCQIKVFDGQNWKPLKDTISAQKVKKARIAIDDNDHLYLNMFSDQSFIKKWNGTEWTEVLPGWPYSPAFSQLDFEIHNNNIYSSVSGYGIFVSRISTEPTGIQKSLNNKLDSDGNYWTEENGNLLVYFKEETSREITLYDLTGKLEVQMKTDQKKVQISGKQSGLYLLQVIGNNNKYSTKVVLTGQQ